MKALILSGGGARGAYQVGVVKAIAELCEKSKVTNPFEIITGVSAGAINSSYLACNADSFANGAHGLVQLWSDLTPERVFKTDVSALSKNGISWIKELSFGGLSKTNSKTSMALLDTAPLRELLKEKLDFGRVQKSLEKGSLKALALTAVDYKSSTAITYIQSSLEIQHWQRARRQSEDAVFTAEHVMASSAIPMLFPPVKLGDRYYGDGCIRNVSPCSPAIHLGAEQLLVIGVRKPSKPEFNLDSEVQNPPSVARVFNMLLNAVLLDGIEIDVERLHRINAFLKQVPNSEKSNQLKPLEALFIAPSEDFGELAISMSHKLPRFIRYLLKGLGPLEEAAEVMSYLLFDESYTTRLIEIGYFDAMKMKDEILEFVRAKKS